MGVLFVLVKLDLLWLESMLRSNGDLDLDIGLLDLLMSLAFWRIYCSFDLSRFILKY